MTTALHAPWVEPAALESDEALTGDTAQGFKGQTGAGAGSPDSASTDADRKGPERLRASAEQPLTASGQALQALEGDAKAQGYLARLRAEQAAPDELALAVAPLYGATLRGFCRAIEKALEGQHHA